LTHQVKRELEEISQDPEIQSSGITPAEAETLIEELLQPLAEDEKPPSLTLSA